MVMIEGRGVVSPASVQVRVDRYIVSVLALEAERREQQRRYRVRRDAWGRGLINEGNGIVSKAAFPILVGCVGEWAFAEFVNSRIGRVVCETDLTVNGTGDGGKDFVICGMMHQIKTRRKRIGPNYVRRVSESRRLQPLGLGRYIFTQWDSRQSDCNLLGWCNHSELVHCELKKSPIAGHWNLEVGDAVLRPMDRIVCEIKSDMMLEATEWH